MAETAYDLVLMDVQMAAMDGYEATAAIRRLEGDAKHTPILAMTANAMSDAHETCLRAGMDDYIPKPVSAAGLAAAIEKHVHKQNSCEP